MMEGGKTAARGVIVGSLAVCIALAIAPWFSGGQEPIAMLLSIGALLLGALLAWRQPQVRTFKIGPLALSYGLFMGFAVLSLIWSADRYSTGVWATQWLMAGLAFRLAYVAAGEPKGREWILRLYFISAVLFCLCAIWIYLTSPYDRLTGLFYWPNPAAAYLIPAIVLGLDNLRKAVGRRVYLWGGVTCLYLASFLLTDSRAATLVLIVILVLYLFVAVTKRAFWIRLVLILVFGAGLGYGLVGLSTITIQHSAKIAPGSRLAEIAEGESESLSDRINYLRSAVAIWVHNPVVGSGAGTYGDLHPQYQEKVVSASIDAHNVYVQTLSELGIVGALLFTAILIWLFAGTLRGVFDNPELMPIAFGVLGLMLHFGLDIDASYPALLMLAAVLLGLAYRQQSQERRAASWRWPAVAAILLIPITSLYLSETWADRAAVTQAGGDYPTAAAEYASAHRGVIYNPAYVNAEGIDYYTVAAIGGSQSKVALALALDRARQAERLAPHDGQNYQLEGRVLILQGHLNEAETALHKALLLDPYDHPQYALDLASAQLLDNKPLEALGTATSMVNLYPDSVVANRDGDVTLRPALGDLEALIGNIEFERGNTRLAQEAARRSLHYNPGNLRGLALAHQLSVPDSSAQ